MANEFPGARNDTEPMPKAPAAPKIPKIERRSVNANIKANLKQGFDTLVKLAGSTVTLAAEIAIVAVLGGFVGSYLNNKTVAEDCKRVSIAKVGDAYIRCTIVELPKDAADKPPR